MELSTQLIKEINNFSDEDKKLLMDLINRMTKKTGYSDIPVLKENDSVIKTLGVTEFPISNDLLKKESANTKELYFQCLAVALIFAVDKKEAPLYIFNRLLAGVKVDKDIEFYLKKAYLLEKEQLYDFFDGIKSKNLKYRFIIDFIVLLGSNNLKEKDLTIVAEFCEALKIGINEVKFLFNIGTAILTQNKKLYWELTAKNISCVNSNIANEYMEIDKMKAEEIYKKASDLFKKFNFKEAFPLLQQLAAAEYPEAFALLYWIYTDDMSYFDKKLSKKCLERGYELGDPIATMLYAMFYRNYDLEKQTLPKVEKLAEEGNIFAEYTLGIVDVNVTCSPPNFYAAVKHFMKAYRMGFYRASWSILLRYRNGDEGFSKDWIHFSLWAEEVLNWGIRYKGFEVAYTYMTIDEYGCSDKARQEEFYKKAVSLWKKLIDIGSSTAATNLGWMYSNGRGVEKSEYEAFKYCQIAADRGDDAGQCNLAISYENGDGTEKNMEKAIFWYKKSAEQGYKTAKDALERLGIRY